MVRQDEHWGTAQPDIVSLNRVAEYRMLPVASGADKFVGIEGSPDVSHCAVIMPVGSAVVPFVPTISKRTELYQWRETDAPKTMLSVSR